MSRPRSSVRIFSPAPEPLLLPEGVIRIEDARLCLDCEVICSSSVCPQCAGESLHPISSWLKVMPELRIERRRGRDRRKRQDPNYKGPERRRGTRRVSELSTSVVKSQ